jgi:hypothetical protein
MTTLSSVLEPSHRIRTKNAESVAHFVVVVVEMEGFGEMGWMAADIDLGESGGGRVRAHFSDSMSIAVLPAYPHSSLNLLFSLRSLRLFSGGLIRSVD